MSIFHLSKYAKRREFFYSLVPVVGMGCLTYILAQDPSWWRLMRFAQAGLILSFAFALMATVRRLHDIAWPGARALWLFVPGANLVLLAILLFKRSAGRKRLGQSRWSGFLPLLLVALVLAALLRLWAVPVGVMHAGMKPLIQPGDYILTRYGRVDRIERGDVIAFMHPAYHRADLGRVIGVAGDQVQMRDGQLWLNDQLVNAEAGEPYVERLEFQGPDKILPRCSGGAVGAGGICEKSLLIQSLPRGSSHAVSVDQDLGQTDSMRLYQFDILNIEEDSYGDKTEVFVVPQDSFFILGDNRDNSIDSRYMPSVGGLGFVAADQVIGRGGRVLISVAGDQVWKVWTWRWNRMLEKVK